MTDNPAVYGLNDGSKTVKFSANDWFYLKTGTGSACATSTSECATNKTKVGTLMTKTDELGSAITRYNDVVLLYGRELLFTINIFVGLVFLCLYIKANSGSIPKLEDVAGDMRSGVSSFSSMIPRMGQIPTPTTGK
jgi:hypothetical protein